VLLGSVLEMLSLLISIIQTVVISQFVLYLLIVFNVVSLNNRFVSAVWQALQALLEPMLDPIRRRMPPAGGIDFSYMVLIFGLYVVRWIVGLVAMASL
jgi:YggT family protein